MHSGRLELVGLHCHIGTFMLSPFAYGVAASKLVELALAVEQKFKHEIKYLDLGGGFASRNTLKGSYLPGSDANPTFDDFAEAISTALLNSNFRQDKLPLLILETGRALVDDAGYLVGSVISNKRSSTGRRNCPNKPPTPTYPYRPLPLPAFPSCASQSEIHWRPTPNLR